MIILIPVKYTTNYHILYVPCINSITYCKFKLSSVSSKFVIQFNTLMIATNFTRAVTLKSTKLSLLVLTVKNNAKGVAFRVGNNISYVFEMKRTLVLY